ncbi:MAG: NADH-quinone oxidoreductase subunit J [Actinobacteria bacterium]|nr:NADH-quinone oxidoreductase subunit J [Actinomycetota bacterium]
MVRATFSLLASFAGVGAIMVLLLVEYVGVALFFMMGVEMVVMAIYMVAFMMNPAGINPMQMLHQRRVATAVGVAVAGALAAVAVAADLPEAPLVAPADTIRALGHELMGGSMLLMQTVGVTLATTMVAAVVLSSARGRFGPADDGSRPPPLDPDEQVEAEPAQAAARGDGHGHGGHG